MTSAAADAATKKRGRPPAEVTAPEKPRDPRGGARPGAGRKSAALEAGSAESHVIYAKYKAKKMAFDAQMAELDFQVKSGKYVARADVVQSNATAFATIAQTLRSIPDNLERRLGISPAVAEEIGFMIDEMMNGLADQMERMAK